MICVFDLILQVIKWCALQCGGEEKRGGLFLFLQTTNPVWGAITNYYVSFLVYAQKLKPELTLSFLFAFYFFIVRRYKVIFSNFNVTNPYGTSCVHFTFHLVFTFESTYSFESSRVCDFSAYRK